MDQETKLLTSTFVTCKKKLKTALNCTLPNPKDSEASEIVRKRGNALFSKRIHNYRLHAELLGLYNQSACLAPNDSQELASAYANRSAFLLHIGKYKECVQDVDKALKITESIELKVKLLCRKVTCWKCLDVDTWGSALDEAQSLVDIIVNNNEKKQTLQDMIHKITVFVPSKVEKTQETKQTINLSATEDVLEKVSIQHDEKYGRHLVAEEDYNPGDVILVEKLFSSSVKLTHRYTNCHHCLKTCWSGVPCDHCDWAIFCSEDCYKRAWNEYHHIECSVGHLLNNALDVPWTKCSITMKIIVNAIKDAGTVEKLRAQLEAVDQCQDARSKGFYKDGKFVLNAVESFYSLTPRKLSVPEKRFIPQIALIFLIGLLRHPQLKNIYHIKNMQDFIHNEDIVFLGSLFIKFTAIRFNNSFSFAHYEQIEEISLGIPGDARGSCLALLMSLVNNSCCPNANICTTEDGKIILYAVEPIKKNSQIFVSYTKEYYTAPLQDRQEWLKRYNFECDCQACTERWPPILITKCISYYGDKQDTFDDSDAAFMKECRDVGQAVLVDEFRKCYSQATIEKLGAKISLAFRKLKQPSAFTCFMQQTLNNFISNVYNGVKPQLLEKCNQFK